MGTVGYGQGNFQSPTDLVAYQAAKPWDHFGYGQGRIQSPTELVAYQVAKPWEHLGMGKVVSRVLPT